MPAFGRLPAPDPRDREYRMSTILPPRPERRWRYYWSSWFGNQGEESSCVGFAWTHFLQAAPVHQTGIDWEPYASFIYRQAQFIDEWPGENYDGTSVRAGAKYLQSEGFITEYRWAWNATDIVRAVLDVGPVVVGTAWYDSMMYPEGGHFPEIGGSVVGGHAYLIDGANLDRQVVRCKNSWGRDWSMNGRFWLTFNQLEFLMGRDGEAALAMEVRK